MIQFVSPEHVVFGVVFAIIFFLSLFVDCTINKAQMHTSYKQCFNYLVSGLFPARFTIFFSHILSFELVSLIYFNFNFLLAFHLSLALPLAKTILFQLTAFFSLTHENIYMQIDAIKIHQKRYFLDASVCLCAEVIFF